MAPALTHTAEPLTLAEAMHHSSSPLSAKYKCLQFPNQILNSDKCTVGLAPLDIGGAESRSPIKVLQCTMEESPPIPSSDCGVSDREVPVLAPVSHAESSMGCHINFTDPSVISAPKSAEVSDVFEHPQQQDLVGFMGVNELIDTLTKLTSNPELLEESERELCPSGQEMVSPEDQSFLLISRLIMRQKQLERRRLHLLRRLRRISARGLGTIVSGQLNHFVSEGKRHLKEANSPSEKETNIESTNDYLSSNFSSVVKKLENSKSNLQSKNLSANLYDEADIVVGKMKATACHHLNHDSDATESSSEESCDEAEEYHSGTAFKSIKERALYKYYLRRGWIGSRWSWLKMQIQDLDKKILEQQKEYKNIREEKGHVIMCDSYGRHKENRLSTEFKCKTPLTCITPPLSKLNGFNQQDPHEDEACSRTYSIYRPKKRRYVRLSEVCKKLFQRSNCNCIPPFTCTLCSSSNNSLCDNSGRRVKQSLGDSIASVDMSFHPVLSKSTEFLQSEVYTSCLARRAPLLSSVSLVSQLSKEEYSESDLEPNKKRRKDLRDIKRKKKDKESHDKIVHSKNIEYMNEDVRWDRSSPQFEQDRPRDRILTRSESAAEKEKERVEKEKAKKNTSLLSSNNHKNKQNSINSYDINNIVIPQSMASVSKVESLQYKEIMTPDWRICDLPPFDIYQETNCLEEDLTDEAFKLRHSISEEKERKIYRKLANVKTNQRCKRSRSARDSSGTNTPDNPLSPRTLDSTTETPIGSPFIEPSEDSNNSSKSLNNCIANPTVLSLSLSNLQSSILEGNQHVNGDDQSRTEVPISKNCRSTNQDKFFRPITPVSMDQNFDKKCLSPYPCRSFPLNEKDVDILHQQTPEPNTNENNSIGSLNSLSNQIQKFMLKSSCGKIDLYDDISVETMKSGCDTPLSEMTDSAPEEDVGDWDDSAPNWTISAVKDSTGCCMLQVERN